MAEGERARHIPGGFAAGDAKRALTCMCSAAGEPRNLIIGDRSTSRRAPQTIHRGVPLRMTRVCFLNAPHAGPPGEQNKGVYDGMRQHFLAAFAVMRAYDVDANVR